VVCYFSLIEKGFSRDIFNSVTSETMRALKLMKFHTRAKIMFNHVPLKCQRRRQDLNPLPWDGEESVLPLCYLHW